MDCGIDSINSGIKFTDEPATTFPKEKGSHRKNKYSSVHTYDPMPNEQHMDESEEIM